MTTDDELRELIALGEKEKEVPWGSNEYIITAANLAPAIAAELIDAREEIRRLQEALGNITNLVFQRLPVDKRWGTAFAFARDALLKKEGDA